MVEQQLTMSQRFKAFVYLHLSHYIDKPFSALHKEWFQLIENQKLAIAAPRGFAKSHFFSFFYAIFRALDSKCDVVLISSSVGIAEKFMAKITQELETNKSLLRTYGPQRTKDSTWRNTLVYLKNGSTIECIGADGKIRGKRPDVILIDDVENDENVLSEDYRAKIKERFTKAWLFTLKPQGQAIVIGTLLHPLSLLSEILTDDTRWKTWTKKKYASLINDKGEPDLNGHSVWEAQWPTALLYAERDECIEAFEQERQNNPIPDELRKFCMADIHFYPILPKGLSYTITVDPAIETGIDNDYTAFIVMGTDTDGLMYVAEAYHKRLEPGEVIDKLFQLYHIYRPHTIGIEDQSLSKLYKKFFELECKKRGEFPNIQPIKLDMSRTGRGKFYRIEALRPFIREARIQLSKDQQALINELLSFPCGSHDDLIDALAVQLEIVKPGRKPHQDIPHGCFKEFWDEKKRKAGKRSRRFHSWLAKRHEQRRNT